MRLSEAQATEWMNYYQLLEFSTVVREGNVSKASEKLRISSSAISAQLRSLEDNFGEKLLRPQPGSCRFGPHRLQCFTSAEMGAFETGS